MTTNIDENSLPEDRREDLTRDMKTGFLYKNQNNKTTTVKKMN